MIPKLVLLISLCCLHLTGVLQAADVEGCFTIESEFSVNPVNDECANAITLPAGQQSCSLQQYTFDGATPSSGDDGCIGGYLPDMWFQTVTTTDVFTVSIGNFSAGDNFYMTVYDNNICETQSGNVLFCADIFPNATYNISSHPGGKTIRFARFQDTGNIEICVFDYTGCALTTTATNTAATCSAWNGTATALPSGGSNNYSYTWSGKMNCYLANGNISQTITDLCPDVYTVIVSDNNTGCLAATSTVVEDKFPAFFSSQSEIDNFPASHSGETIYPCPNGVYIGSSSNDEITNLDGLSQINSFTGGLIIADNYYLTSIAGLGNVQLMGYFSIINTALTNLLPLSNLNEVGILEVYGNPSLTSLNGLEHINPSLLTELYITDNPSVSTCEIQPICDYLSNPSNYASISGNATNCATRTAVEAACLLALPVSLNSFTARPQKTNIRLLWRTESESQNDHFDIEHSRNGVSFETIGKMAGQGTTAEAQDYQFIHQKPGSGIHYYRLKQVDFGGKYGYSPVVSIDLPGFGDLEGLALFPNPTTGLVHFSTEIPEGAGFAVSDVLGRVLLQGDLLTPQIDLSELQPGLYRVSIMSGFQSNTLLLLKE